MLVINSSCISQFFQIGYQISDLVIVYIFIQKEKILELERYLEDLDEQLSLVRRESNAKDELLAKQTKVSEETIAG